MVKRLLEDLGFEVYVRPAAGSNGTVSEASLGAWVVKCNPRCEISPGSSSTASVSSTTGPSWRTIGDAVRAACTAVGDGSGPRRPSSWLLGFKVESPARSMVWWTYDEDLREIKVGHWVDCEGAVVHNACR
jgi:hypothetical protein